MKINFKLKINNTENILDTDTLILKSEIEFENIKSKKNISNALITVTESGIDEIKFNTENTHIHATCIKV